MTGTIEEAFENFLYSVNPCDMCDRKKDGNHTNPCHSCGYFYGSKFKSKVDIDLEKKCENCKMLNKSAKKEPCLSCDDGSNWVKK